MKRETVLTYSSIQTPILGSHARITIFIFLLELDAEMSCWQAHTPFGLINKQVYKCKVQPSTP